MSLHHRRLNKKMWARTRFLAFTRDKFRCVKCGLAGKLEGHHKQKLSCGGSEYDPANVETLCKNCHIECSVSPARLEWKRYLKTKFQEINQ